MVYLYVGFELSLKTKKVFSHSKQVIVGWNWAFDVIAFLILILILINIVLIEMYFVLIFGKSDEVEPIGLLLLFQSLNRCVHVDCECYDDVEANDDAKVVKDDEEVAPGCVASHDIDAHLHDDIPVIDDNENEESHIRRHQIIEVDEVVVVGDWRVLNDLWRILFNFSSKDDHAHLSEDVEDCHHDNDQVVKRSKQVLERLKDDTHDFDLIQES